MARQKKVVYNNRKARCDYTIGKTYEAGIILQGGEIKSIRQGRVNIRDAYAKPESGELWLFNCHIAQYKEGNRYNHEPTRPRKLLLHKREIVGLTSDVARKGLTLVPLKLYLKNGRAKIELGLAKGKKFYDKRRSIIERETDRDMAQAVKVRKR